MSDSEGKVVGVHGSVVDLEFRGALPAIRDLVTVEWDGPHALAIEIQQHADEHTARGVALQDTGGLRRGERVRASGRPLEVPVGEPVLGRLVDVTGGRAGASADGVVRERERGAIGCARTRSRPSCWT